MDICVIDKCNNRCLMCTNPEPPWIAWDGGFDYSYTALVERVKKIKEKIKSDDSIYLSGGEPTLHPRFIKFLNYLKENFPQQRVKLLTNGRRFAYEDFARETMAVNENFEVDLSMYGADQEGHDRVTRSRGSFNQTFKGLKNILKYKTGNQLVGVRFVITELSYKSIKNFLEQAAREFKAIDRLILIFWEIEARAVKNFDKLKINYLSVAKELEKTALQFNDFNEIRLYHFPLCVLSIDLWPYVWRTLNQGDVKFMVACRKCRARNACLGIPQAYLKYFGPKEFKAVNAWPKKLKIGDDMYHPIKTT